MYVRVRRCEGVQRYHKITIGRILRSDAVGKIEDYVVAIVPTHSIVNLHRHAFPLQNPNPWAFYKTISQEWFYMVCRHDPEVEHFVESSLR